MKQKYNNYLDYILYHSKGLLYKEKYENLCEFFGYDLNLLELKPCRDYILEALHSHDINLILNKIYNRYKSKFDIEFINLSGVKSLYKSVSFQIYIKNVFNDVLNTNSFINLINFYGYQITLKLIITNFNKRYYNTENTGIYYTISPMWADDVSQMVYLKNKGILYHFSTGKEHIKESILKNGLRIKNNTGREYPSRIYAYSYFGNIKQNNLYKQDVLNFITDIISKEDIYNFGVYVFKIDLNMLYYNNINFYTDDAMEDINSVYTYNNIPAKSIKYIGKINYQQIYNED